LSNKLKAYHSRNLISETQILCHSIGTHESYPHAEEERGFV